MSSFKFDENHQIKPCIVIPFDDGSTSATTEAKEIADKYHLLQPHQTAYYTFIYEHLKDNGKVLKEDLLHFMQKNKVQGITFRKTISKIVTTVCKQSSDHGGSIREINHNGEIWVELIGGTDEG